MRILPALGALALVVFAASGAFAQTNITSIPGVQAYGSNAGNSRDVMSYQQQAQQAAEAELNNTTYKMDSNGFLVPTESILPAGAPGQAQQQAPVSQKANNPTKQVYKGGQKKMLVAPRTHRMYEDTKY